VNAHHISAAGAFDRIAVWFRRLRKSPRQRALTLVFFEAMIVGVMFAALETWLVPLLLRLSASPFQIALLSAVPFMAMIALGPFSGAIIAKLGGNKAATIITSCVQSACLLALIACVQYPDASWSLPTALTLAISIGAVGGIAGPAWFSWIGDLIPTAVSGRFLSSRMQVLLLTKLGFSFIFASIIEYWPIKTCAIGLQSVFIAGALSRLLSVFLLIRTAAIVRARKSTGLSGTLRFGNNRGLMAFVRTIHLTEIGRWTLVWAIMHFGVMVAAPYYSTYMLFAQPDGLGLDHAPHQYNLLLQIASVMRMVFFPLAGRLVDVYGPAPILRLAMLGITVIPFFWSMIRSFPLLLTIESVNGLCWCLAECAVGVLILGCHKSTAQRTRLIGYHQTVVACAVLAGMGVGAAMFQSGALPQCSSSQFQNLFLVSAIMRIPALVLALRFLPTLPDVEPGSLTGLWRLIPGVHPTITLSRGLMRYFRRG
jgi:MFS family permease